ncbi:MAG: tyrosine-type recombinase/integrase [Anaerolineae bacterium]|nr:tyrosine-type recombinase/integrase [Anaerolineae bacterium]
MTELSPVQPSQALSDDNIAALIDTWLAFERAEGASENTLDAYRKGIAVFRTWLDAHNETPGAVAAETVRQFKTGLLKTYSAQTVNLRLSAVRSFYRYLVSHGRMPINPASEIKGAKRTKSRRHKRDALSNGEVRDVLKTCNGKAPEAIRDRAMLILFAYCALREVEVHRANIGQLKTQGDRLVLEVQGKGRTEADEIVVIPHSQEAAIRAWLTVRMKIVPNGDGDPLFISLSNRSHGSRLALRSIRAMVKQRYAQADVVGRRKTTHSLRHSAITNAIRRGATPLQVQQMARHSSFDTTLGYYHETARVDNPAEDLIDYANHT